MVATPVHTAPIGDRLTGDRIRSRQDSRLSSSLGPLWMLLLDSSSGIPSQYEYHIAELIADDMGLIVRRKKIDFLDPGGEGGRRWEFPAGIGGDNAVIWLATYQGGEGGETFGRIYDLDPITFNVRRETGAPFRFNPQTSGLTSIDGDKDVLYVGQDIGFAGSYGLWKLDAETLRATHTHLLAVRPLSIAGDKGGCWVGDWTHNEILHLNASLQEIRTVAWPLTDEGHRGVHIGGGSHRLYIDSVVEPATSDWSAGRYMLTADPQQLENGSYRVLRSYGPWESEWGSRGHGGM